MDFKRHFGLIAAVIFTFVSFNARSQTSSLVGITPKTIAENFTNYNKITPRPVAVNPELFSLCVGPSQKQIDAARATNGPHAFNAITIYMNELATKSFSGGSNSYPPGAVIVKQKSFPTFDTSTNQQAANVGGMIKRPAGFDPTHGDWEYFYFDDPTKIESGAIASCVQCHQSARSKDYVFGSWSHPPADH